MSVGREPIKVFGHEVRPLTFDQVERIEAALFPAEGKKFTNVQLAREIIGVGLSRHHAETKVGDLECDLASLSDAMQAILRLGGFAPQGEAPAAAGNAPSPSIGALSEAG